MLALDIKSEYLKYLADIPVMNFQECLVTKKLLFPEREHVDGEVQLELVDDVVVGDPILHHPVLDLLGHQEASKRLVDRGTWTLKYVFRLLQL
jgi:hypothetical protein